MVRDITERKRAEEALREVREGERNRMVRDLHDGALQDLTYALAEAQIIRVISEDLGLGGRLDDRIGALRRTERRLHVQRYRPGPAQPALRGRSRGGRSQSCNPPLSLP